MPDYRLSAAADRDLTGIYRYTFDAFGEAQADAYFESLDRLLNRLAVNPELGRNIDHIRAGYRRYVHRRHLVYYKTAGDGIFVVRILGPGMSPERHLREN